MSEIAEQRAVGSQVKLRPTLCLPRDLLVYVGCLGTIVAVSGYSTYRRYAVAFGDGRTVYVTDEQLA